MIRPLLFLVLSIVIARMFWRVVDNIIEGATGFTGQSRASRVRPPAGRPPGVAMVRDPICGTFLLPDRAVALVDGRDRVYFCSDACRDEYRTRAGRTA
jgi:YHS domain-containing protein